MLPDNDILAAKADSIFETAHEMSFPLNPTINFAVGAEFEKAKNTIDENIMGRLQNFENILNSTSNPSFFLGGKPFYCDFCVYHHLSLLRLLDSNIFNKYSNSDQFMNSIENNESID